MVRADDLTPSDLLQTLWRVRHLALALAVVCAAAGYGYSVLLPDRFTASTLVLIEEWQLPQSYVQSTATVNLGARLRTLSQQILSRSRLESLMKRYGLFGDPADPVQREKMLAKLRKRIAVNVTGDQGFRISFTHEDPEVAAAVANELATFYINDSHRALEQQSTNTTSALQQQRERLKAQLDVKEREIREFKSANMGMLPEQLSANLETLDRLQQQLSDNSSRLAAARSRKSRSEAEAAGTAGARASTVSARERARQLLTGTNADNLSSQLASEPPRVRLEVLKLQRDALLRRYTPRHPDVQMLELQIADLEQQLAAAPDPGLSHVQADPAEGAPPAVAAQIRDAQREIRDLLAERQRIQQQMSEYQRRIEGAPEVEEKLRGLERDYNTLLQEYQGIVRRSMEAELAGNLQRNGPFARFRVVDQALPPQVPSGPLRVLFLLGGGLIGAGLVFGGALGVEMALEPLRSAREVERFAGLEVLASIPFIETARFRQRRRARRLASYAAVGGVLAIVFVLRLLMRP